MKRTLVVVALISVGCGDASTPAPLANRSGGQADATADAGPNAIREPAAVAERFIRAIVSGDRLAAQRELTANAAARVAREPQLLQPLGLATVELRIGEVRLLGPAEAAVQVLITESGSEGADEVGCLLKRDSAKWGVCGLASNAGDGAEPVVIGFESTPQVEPPLVDAASSSDPPERTARAPAGAATR